MAKLVVLSEGLKGRTYELKAENTTVGRVEDNAFHIPEGSVSSHHCEIIVRGADVFVKDLNSTNGTFVNGKQVKTEAQLLHGQILRLGQVELRFEDPDAKPSAPAKKVQDKTQGMKGVKLETGQGQAPSFGKDSPFAKKSNQGTKVFIICAVVLAVAIVVVIAYSLTQVK
jgi:pSer/pThr/pTyr-binding forkhead associated (FHA) protein